MERYDRLVEVLELLQRDEEYRNRVEELENKFFKEFPTATHQERVLFEYEDSINKLLT